MTKTLLLRTHYIFILVSYFRMRSEHALLNIPRKSKNKIRPSLQLPHFHEKGCKRQYIKKLTKLSITPSTMFFKILCVVTNINFTYFE